MTTYLLVDTANTFFRARHVAHRGMDQWTRLGFAMHVTMSAVNKAWRIAGADHVVFALEGRSWRKIITSHTKRIARLLARHLLNNNKKRISCSGTRMMT